MSYGLYFSKRDGICSKRVGTLGPETSANMVEYMFGV